MPFYDLRCEKCQIEFKNMASMKEREELKIKCPKCGNTKLSPVFKNVHINRSKKESSLECPDRRSCNGRGCGCA